jgi:8-oxo-dGTP pyrophosphatase MutT (NUDIX family)
MGNVLLQKQNEDIMIDLLNQTNRYLSLYANEEERLAPLFQQFKLEFDILDRKTMPGHITASGIGIEDGKMLMIFHPFLKRWLQPGGHIDKGETPLIAAQREVLEETGRTSIVHPWHNENLIPFDIDVHFIPANHSKNESAHFHYDFRFLLIVDKSTQLEIKDQHLCKWIAIQNVEEKNLHGLINKLVHQNLLNSWDKNEK